MARTVWYFDITAAFLWCVFEPIFVQEGLHLFFRDLHFCVVFLVVMFWRYGLWCHRRYGR